MSWCALQQGLQHGLEVGPRGLELQTLQAHAAFDVRALSLGTQVLWKDRLVGPSYSVVNVRAGYRLDLGRQRLGLFSEIRNLFDTNYAEIFDAPMPRRWWLFGVQLVR